MRNTRGVFCVECLEDALREHGKPEVFNSDQGSKFTSDDSTGVLKRENIASPCSIELMSICI